MNPLPTLRTDRTILRPLTIEDSEALHLAHSDPGVHHFWSGPAHATLEQTRAYTADTIGYGPAWAITADGGEALGRLVLHQHRDGVGEFGIILRAAAHGKGHGGDAIRLVSEWAFANGYHRLVADVDQDNAASLALFERNGFVREGYFRQNWKTHLGKRDSVMLAKLKEEQMAFGFESTTDDVLDGVNLSGKRILVTGASAGLGVETIRALKAHGATVVGAARDLAKAKRALGEAGVGDIELVELDLASLASCRKAADALVAKGDKFDLLIANAGVMACPQGKTADGFETQFGTNHLGHFTFINRLVPLLNSPGRIVTLTSAGHRFSDVNLEDPNFETTPYGEWAAYGRSKTANALYAVGLDKRLKSRGVRAAAVHPGGIMTELGRHLTPDLIKQMTGGRDISEAFKFKTIPQGAATTVWAGVRANADEVGARYCEDCRVAGVTDDPAARAGVRAYAIDPARADALWTKSEEMVGEKFAF